MPDAPHLTGYAHGASGIAHALLELFAVTGDARLRDVALEAFRYERSLFSAALGNWPALGVHDGRRVGRYGVGWCPGARGFGLARARAAELLGDEDLRGEAEIAARTTAAALPQMTEPPYGNLSLCHGAAGNAELMLQAHRVLGAGRWLEAARSVGTTGIERYLRAGLPWPGGVTGGGASPSLMLGAAGTGYFYLRLADPERTPPILIVLPPADDAARQPAGARGGALAGAADGYALA
jgi:lantibiotic modifying enzyme